MRTVLAYFPSALGLLGLAVGVLYCFQNGSGHSGVDPISASLCFLPLLGTGLLMFFLKKWKRAALIATVVGLFGLAFGTYVSELKIMRAYEVWVKGAQDMSAHIGLQLSLYVLVLLVALVASWWLTRNTSRVVQAEDPVIE